MCACGACACVRTRCLWRGMGGVRRRQTGTKSLQLALERLGHKIYDIQSIMGAGHLELLEHVVLDEDRQPVG